MFCDRCGANNEDAARFCHSCGNRLSDGSEGRPSGPAWSSLDAPTQPPVEEPLVIPTPPLPVLPETPLSEQMRVGPQTRSLPLRNIAFALAGLAAAGGIGAGIFLGVTRVDDWSFLPFVGGDEEQMAMDDGEGGDDGPASGASATATTTATPEPPQILATVQRDCRDLNGDTCQLRWNLVEVEQESDLLSVLYELEVTGVQGCSVQLPSDLDIHMQSRTAGEPGVYVEGDGGRFYPLVAGTRPAGPLDCKSSVEGSWAFLPPAGESAVKFRHPAVPPFQIDLTTGTVGALPEDDPTGVLPADALVCVADGNIPCAGKWEIGPFGLDSDGLPTVFFAVRWDAEGGCTVQWIDDLSAHEAALGRGEAGIRLEAGATVLPLTATGGLAATAGPQDCGSVHHGWWKFEQGDLGQSALLFYPDLPQIELSLAP